MSIEAARVAGIATGVLLVLEAIVCLVPQGETAADGWVRRWTVGEIAGAREVSQTFTPRANGLHAVSFAASAVGVPSNERARILVKALDGDPPTPVVERHVPIVELVADEWYRVEFPEVADSNSRVFSVTIAVPEAKPGDGIAVQAMKGDYDDGEFVFNGVRRWGSLRFTAEVARPTYLSRWMNRWSRMGLSPLRTALAAVAWALFHFLAVLSMIALFEGIPSRSPERTPHRV